jgi:hypothetical protein
MQLCNWTKEVTMQPALQEGGYHGTQKQLHSAHHC